MSAGWEIKTLDQISVNLDNRRKPVTKTDRVGGEFPYYGASGIVDYVADYIFDEDTLLVSEDGANLLARSTPIAFPASGKYWVNNHAHILKFSDPTTQRFVELYLASIPLDSYITGAAQPKLNQTALNSIPIPVPSLPEQQRIVTLLDEAFDGIATARAHAERNLQNARAIFESHLQSVFARQGEGWVKQTLGDTYDVRDGTHDSPKYHSKGFPLITSKNLKRDGLSFDDVKLINDTDYRKINERSAVHKGDVLLAMIGTIGNPVVVEQEPEFAIKNVALLKVPSNQISHFLRYYLSSQFVVDKMQSEAKGTTQKFVGLGYLRAFPITIPSFAEQIRIVGELNELAAETQRLESLYQRKLTALDELKKSLLHQAFSGQLTSAKRTNASLPAALQTTTPEFTANVICLAYARHVLQKREKTFGRVKEQKVLHLVESIARIDLGRHPMKDAAGPNDFQHMLKAEEWAKAHNVFEMVKREGGYDFKKLSAFDEHLSRVRQALAPYLPQLQSVMDILVPMDKEEAEVFATVHAAWNNLLIDRRKVTDDAIVSAARDDWHADKTDIPKDKFRAAIALIRQKNLVPDGSAKYVGGQQTLL